MNNTVMRLPTYATVQIPSAVCCSNFPSSILSFTPAQTTQITINLKVFDVGSAFFLSYLKLIN